MHRMDGDLRPFYMDMLIHHAYPFSNIHILTRPNVDNFADSSAMLIFHNASCCWKLVTVPLISPAIISQPPTSKNHVNNWVFPDHRNCLPKSL